MTKLIKVNVVVFDVDCVERGHGAGAAIVADIPAPLQVLSPERSDAKHHRGVRRQTLFSSPSHKKNSQNETNLKNKRKLKKLKLNTKKLRE